MIKILLAGLAALATVPNVALAAPTIVGTHYEDNQDANCPSNGVCRISFTVTPAGKYLMIERVNCHTQLSGAGLTSVVLAISTSQTDPMFRFKWVPATALANGSVTDYVADLETEHLVGPNRYPTIVLRSGVTTFRPYATCSIVGTLQNM